jgi:hypothetical protein
MRSSQTGTADVFAPLNKPANQGESEGFQDADFIADQKNLKAFGSTREIFH